MLDRFARGAPRVLIALLATVVTARLAIAFVVDSSWLTAMGWASLLALLSLGTLWGKHAASTALAYLCLILGADTLLQLFSVDVPRVHLIAALLWALLTLGTGTYLLASARVKRFFAQAHGAQAPPS